MARNDNYLHFTLRLNMDIPEQMRIARALKNVDSTKYKSQNKYIMDAIEFFMNYSDEGVEADTEKTKFVRKEELSEIEKRISKKAIMTAKDEVIRLLGSIIAKGISIGEAEVIGQTTQTDSIDDALLDVIGDYDDF